VAAAAHLSTLPLVVVVESCLPVPVIRAGPEQVIPRQILVAVVVALVALALESTRALGSLTALQVLLLPMLLVRLVRLTLVRCLLGPQILATVVEGHPPRVTRAVQGLSLFGIRRHRGQIWL
jgi:hypothetical protein